MTQINDKVYDNTTDKSLSSLSHTNISSNQSRSAD